MLGSGHGAVTRSSWAARERYKSAGLCRCSSLLVNLHISTFFKCLVNSKMLESEVQGKGGAWGDYILEVMFKKRKKERGEKRPLLMHPCLCQRNKTTQIFADVCFVLAWLYCRWKVNRMTSWGSRMYSFVILWIHSLAHNIIRVPYESSPCTLCYYMMEKNINLLLR